MRISIATKLTWLLLLAGLTPLIIVGYLNYKSSVEMMTEEIKNNLNAFAETKASHINTYFDDRRKDVDLLAHSPVIIDVAPNLIAAFKTYGKDLPEYAALDKEIRIFLTFYIETLGYYDLFLISPAGDIVFSMMHENDFLTNLKTGPYKDSELAKSFIGAATLLETAVSDFLYYEPSEEYGAFIAAPIFRQGVTIGVLAAQMGAKAIYELVQDYTGLGMTGETILASRIGDRAVFLNPLRRDSDASFEREVVIGSDYGVPIQQAVQGRKGTGVFEDYRGEKTLAAWRYLPHLRLGMVVKQDTAEAFAPVYILRNQSLAVGSVVLLVLISAALLLSRTISTPIKNLTRTTELMAGGNMSARADIRPGDEIGVLGTTFNDMAEKLQHQAESLKRFSFELETIVDAIPGLVFSKDKKNRYLRVNKYLADALKMKKEELEGKDCFEIYPRKQAQAYLDDDLEVINSGKPKLNNDEVWETEDGARWISSSKIPYFDERGEVIGVIGVAMDITKRKEAEKALVESERRLNEAQKIAHIGHWELNLVTNELNWSDEIYRMFEIDPKKFGASYEAFLGVIHQDDRDFVNKAYTDSLKNKTEYDIVHRLMFKAKRVKYVNERCRTEYDKEGNPVRSLGIVQDITERHLAQEKIKEYSESLELMVEERTEKLKMALNDSQDARDKIDGIIKSIADGLIVIDSRKRIVLMNHAAEELLGIRLSSAIGRSLDFAVRDKSLQEKLTYTFDKIKEGYEFDFEHPGEDPKNPRIMRARTSLLGERDGTKVGTVLIIHDVTHEREVDRMKTEFLTTAAHELRTPLTSIQGFSEILMTRDKLDVDERHKYLGYINKQSVSLGKLITDLLDVSRIESRNRKSIRKTKSDIREIIKEVVFFFEEQNIKNKLIIEIPQKPVNFSLDPEKINRVLKNLIGNAVKYSPEGGDIRIALMAKENACQILIEDQGIGMTSEQVAKIFDKFYRVDASDSAPDGTGLGMTIVKYLVESHGGTINIESELKKGTKVTITLPLLKT